MCAHTQTITPVLFVANTRIETRPIRFNMSYRGGSHKTASLSVDDIFVKVSGLNALRLLVGAYKLNASFSVDIDLKQWPNLQYKLKLDYSIHHKKAFARTYSCVACKNLWRRHGAWSVTSLLQTLALSAGN